MKRMKRLSIRRIALGVAFAALVVPATALAKPMPGSGPILNGDQQVGTSQDSAYLQAVSRGNVYIPLQGDTSVADSAYATAVSRGNVYIPLQGSGITSSKVTAGALGSDDRAVSRATSEPVVNQHRAWGPVISYDTRYASMPSPDDRAFSKATSVGVGQPESQEQIGLSNDSGNYPIAAFVLVLLAMSGTTLIVWRNRRDGGRLSPA
jgi:hypothetical protein